MLEVSVAHLEQKLFEFEILQFLNLAYFLHIKANFKPKCLNTIENYAFSNEYHRSCQIVPTAVMRIFSERCSVANTLYKTFDLDRF